MAKANPKKLDALIVGAGFAGLYMVKKLRDEGFEVEVVEAGSGVGGTWFWNRYPGARCDIPSIEYSYSFDAELEAEWRWTERYATQPEILRYLDHVAGRFDLRRSITFNTKVTAATWREEDARWSVETDKGSHYDAQFVILATGALSTPKLPDLPGLAKFEGSILHTAQWDDEVALDGRNVAVFGTGSSGVQAIPQIAKRAARVTVFQRTPNFAVPASNHPLSEDYLDEMAPKMAQLREGARQSPLGWFDGMCPGSAVADSPEGRAKRFEQQWNAGTTGLLRAYEDLLVDEKANSYAAEFARDKISEMVKDPEKARKLTPQGYPIGSRRLCSEIGFYDAFNRDNVDLIDVREEPVEEITADAIRTAKSTVPTDVIVFATGFDACIGAIKAIEITGKGGKQLASEWLDGPRCYLGLSVSGFPNMFTVTGPGSPSVLSNVVLSIEQHVDWIARCMSDMRAERQASIEADADAEQAWMEHAHDVAHSTLFPKADSWYQGRTRDGRQVFMPYVGGCGAYRAKCDEVADAGYAGFHLSKTAAPEGQAAHTGA